MEITIIYRYLKNLKTMLKILGIWLCLLVVRVWGVDYDGWLNIAMYHNLNCGGEAFCQRGTISIKSIRMGTSIIDQVPFTSAHLHQLKRGNPPIIPILHGSMSLYGSEVLDVVILLARRSACTLADEDGFYIVQAIVTSAEQKNVEFLSSMKAAAFLDSGLSDSINVWVTHTGAVISIGFQVTNSSNALSNLSEEQKVSSKFYLRHIDQAPVPDTATYIQKLEREREAREKGELKDNRSFLAKYWMYIVPVAIFVMISGAANPEPAPAAR